jgi:hypothetical protein
VAMRLPARDHETLAECSLLESAEEDACRKRWRVKRR